MLWLSVMGHSFPRTIAPRISVSTESTPFQPGARALCVQEVVRRRAPAGSTVGKGQHVMALTGRTAEPTILRCTATSRDTLVVIDAIRCDKLPLNHRVAGALTVPSAYSMESPQQQYTDDEARR